MQDARPADIVGAIAGETGISGEAIGAIDLYDRFAFVEVPGDSVEKVLAGMHNVTIRNRPVRVKLAARRRAAARAATRKRQARAGEAAARGIAETRRR
jgi:DbpA-like RNA binding protein